jgi:hypothetical protein
MKAAMSDDQFTKLTGQITGIKDDLGQRIDTVKGELQGQIDSVRDDLSDQILKLYQHTENRFGELEAKLEAKADRQDLDRIYDALDAILKNQETEQQERAAIITQLDRHERWHHQTAAVLDLKLDY